MTASCIHGAGRGYGKKENKSQMKICDSLIKRNAPAIKQRRQTNDAIVSAVISY